MAPRLYHFLRGAVFCLAGDVAPASFSRGETCTMSFFDRLFTKLSYNSGSGPTFVSTCYLTPTHVFSFCHANVGVWFIGATDTSYCRWDCLFVAALAVYFLPMYNLFPLLSWGLSDFFFSLGNFSSLAWAIGLAQNKQNRRGTRAWPDGSGRVRGVFCDIWILIF